MGTEISRDLISEALNARLKEKANPQQAIMGLDETKPAQPQQAIMGLDETEPVKTHTFAPF